MVKAQTKLMVFADRFIAAEIVNDKSIHAFR